MNNVREDQSGVLATADRAGEDRDDVLGAIAVTADELLQAVRERSDEDVNAAVRWLLGTRAAA